MSIRMLNTFVAETDDLKDFKSLLKTVLKIKFAAVGNPDPEFNYIKIFKESIGYWCIHDDKKERVLACTLVKYCGENDNKRVDLIKIPMQRVETESKKFSHKFKWTNYNDVIDTIIDLVKAKRIEVKKSNPPAHMLDGDGSTDISYKIEVDHNQMYISIGHCYYGK